MEAMAVLFSFFFIIMYFVIIFGILAVAFVGNWFIFKKAGQEGWKALIPYYNSWVLSEFTMGDTLHRVYPFLPP